MLACLLLTGDDLIFESVYSVINTGEEYFKTQPQPIHLNLSAVHGKADRDGGIPAKSFY